MRYEYGRSNICLPQNKFQGFKINYEFRSNSKEHKFVFIKL